MIVANLFNKGFKIHLYFLVTLLLITVIITLQSQYDKEITPRAILVYFLVVCCIYNGRWLTQQFLIKNRWFYLILLSSITITVFSVVGVISMMYLLGYREESDISAFVVITPLLVMLTMFGGGLIAITRIVIQQQINEVKILQIQMETELHLLASRLSPHFLFNTLNNLYGLSIDEHQKVPGLLLKLSALLSYSLYSSNETFVKLEDELDYIKNFIELEKIRVSDRLVLNLDINDIDGSLKIAPMVLIVFVENAFKHAKHTLNKHVHIDIRIWVKQQTLHLMINNNCSEEQIDLKELNSGIGIATTIKRLDLLYGKRYHLKYGKVNSNYCVNLELGNDAKS